ncbi:MAG: 7-cyano-7-deazaguanine synthase [Candidatus Krumholzibacteria bacterium]|nr:7-cyano-7-deazaguanine synthase [Candidatus Krumholzibacteria bacterium]
MTDYRGRRAVALVSGGLDSVVSLARADIEMEIRLVLFINYGQRAIDRERNAVLGVVNFYGHPFEEVEVGWLGRLAPQGMRATPATTQVELECEPVLDTLDAVWVPNRNGIFINIAAAFAESYDCEHVVTGFNRQEGVEFPDNRQEYVSRVNGGLALSTRIGVSVVSFTQELDKKEILRLGAELHAPLSVIWSCYHSQELMCGRCASCRRLKDAMAGVPEEVRPPLEFKN